MGYRYFNTNKKKNLEKVIINNKVYNENKIPLSMEKASSCVYFKFKLNLIENNKTFPEEFFKDVNELAKVDFLEGFKEIKSIPKGAFKNCIKLSHVEIPSTVEVIEEEAFAGCTKLTSIKIPSSVKEIKANAFQGCLSLIKLEIGRHVQYIDTTAFQDCNFLSTVIIESIDLLNKNGDKDYNHVNNLEDVFNPNVREYILNINSENEEISLPSELFADCQNLLSVKISKNIKYIPSNFCYNCKNLLNFSYLGDNPETKDYCVRIPSFIEGIGSNAFKNCKKIKKIILPKTLKSIDDNSFKNCQIQKIDFINNSSFNAKDYNNFGITFFSKITETGLYCSNTTLALYKGPKVSLSQKDFPEEIDTLGEEAFAQTGVESITLPNTIKNINYNCFIDSNIKKIHLNRVNKISTNAFSSCSKLKDVSILSHLEKIDKNAFNNCKNLEEVTIENQNILLGNTIKKSVIGPINTNILYGEQKTLSNSSVTISNNSSMFSINKEKNIEELPESNNLKIKDIFGQQVKKYNLKNPIVGDKLTTIAPEFFSDTLIYSIEIPSTITTFGKKAFNNCKNLSQVILNNKPIEENPFDDQKIEFKIPYLYYDFYTQNPNWKKDKQIRKNYSFSFIEDSDRIFEIKINDKTSFKYEVIKYTGNKCYAKLLKVNTVEEIITLKTIQKNSTYNDNPNYILQCIIKDIDKDCFKEVTSIKELNLDININDVEHFNKELFNDCENLKTIRITSGIFTKDVKDRLPDNIECFILENIESLENELFKDNTYLKSIKLKAKTSNIPLTGNDIFTIENNLVNDETTNIFSIKNQETDAESVYNRQYNGKITLGNNVFINCSNLSECTIDKIQKIGNNAFKNCSNLSTLNIDIVQKIGNHAFEGCTKLSKVTINSNKNHDSKNELTIGKYAFSNCSSLLNVTLNNIKLIDDQAFKDCSLLKNITFNCNKKETYSDSETYDFFEIGNQAFMNCTSLENIDLKEVNKLGDFVFEGAFIEDEVKLEFSPIIPILGKYDSLKIGENIFKDSPCKYIDLTLNSLGFVGKNLIYYFGDQIKSYTLNNQINSINIKGVKLFYGSTNTNKIILSENIDEIPKSTFEKCENLLSIAIPKNVKKIGEYCFWGCNNLNIIQFDWTQKNEIINYDYSKDYLGYYAGMRNPNSDPYVVLVIPYQYQEGENRIQKYYEEKGWKIHNESDLNPVERFEDGKIIFNNQNIEKLLLDLWYNRKTSEEEKSSFNKNFFTKDDLDKFTSDDIKDIYDDDNKEIIQTGLHIGGISIDRFNNSINTTNAIFPEFEYFSNANFKYLYHNLFVNNYDLKNIKFPENLVEILIDGTNINKNNDNYYTYTGDIVIPQSIAKIGGLLDHEGEDSPNYYTGNFLYKKKADLFNNLSSIYVEDGNYVFSSRNNNSQECNCIYNTQLYSYEGKTETINILSDSLILGCKNTIIPENIKFIMRYAFKNIIFDNEISIPNSVQIIHDYAFYECNNNKDLYIHVNWDEDSLDNLEVGENAFYNCCINKKIYLILSSEYYKNRELLNKYKEKFKKFRIISEKLEIEDNNFKKYLIISNKYHDTNISTTTLSKLDDEVIRLSDYDNENNELKEEFKTLSGILRGNATNSSSCNDIKTTVQVIKELHYFSWITSIDNGVQDSNGVYTGVFENWTDLSEIIIPDNIDTIGIHAFKNCKNLSRLNSEKDGEFNLPSTIKYIYTEAFRDCHSLITFNFSGNNIEILQVSTFAYCENLETVNGLENLNKITEIGAWTFLGCLNLKNIEIPDTITFIGYLAFGRCISLDHFVIDNKPNVEVLSNRSFYECVKLTNITIPANIKKVAFNAFENINLEKVTLKNVFIPISMDENYRPVDLQFTPIESVWRIFKNSEEGKVVKLQIDFERNIGDIEIPDYMFYRCDGKTKEFTLPYVSRCKLLDFTIHPNVVKIGDQSFGCISNIHFIGNQPSTGANINRGNRIDTKDNVKILIENNDDRNIHKRAFLGYYAPTIGTGDIADRVITDSYTLSILENGGAFIFNNFDYTAPNNNRGFIYILLKNTNTEESVLLFVTYYKYYPIKSINLEIPSDVKIIAQDAFYTSQNQFINDDDNYKKDIGAKIEKIEKVSNVKYILDCAFCTCGKLSQFIDFGSINGNNQYTKKEPSENNNLIFIGARAFENCKALEIVHLPSNVEIIEQRAFSNCPKLTQFGGYSSKITGLQNENFFIKISNLKELRGLVFMNSFTEINDSAKKIDIQLYNLPELITDPLTKQNNFWCEESKPSNKGLIYFYRYYYGDQKETDMDEFKTKPGWKELNDSNFWSPVEKSSKSIAYINDSLSNNPNKEETSKSSETKSISKNNNDQPTDPVYFRTEINECEFRYESSKKMPVHRFNDGFLKIESSLLSHTFENGKGVLIFNNPIYKLPSALFSGDALITSIELPSTIVSLEEGAFAYCKKLETLIFNNSLQDCLWHKYEGKYYGYLGQLPNNDEYMFQDTKDWFYESHFIENVYIKSSNLEEDHTYLSMIKFIPEGNIDFGNVHRYYDGNEITGNFEIPKGIKKIGHGAFYNCRNLTSIIIPEGVTEIGPGAFYNCKNLTSVTIPDTVTNIETRAFFGCSSLTNINIPNSVTNIGVEAFSNCSSLSSITIPDSITVIKNSVFDGCSSLTSVTIPRSVTKIGSSAFCGCINLTSINSEDTGIANIYNSITFIGSYAFNYCTGLQHIIFEENIKITDIYERTFEDCENLIDINIPFSISKIYGGAFRRCSNLENIYFSNPSECNFSSRECIAVDAFDDCPKLQFPPLYNNHDFIRLNPNYVGEFTIPQDIIEIADYAFYGCNQLTKVVIPKSVAYINEGFRNCLKNITELEVEDHNPYYYSLNNMILEYPRTTNDPIKIVVGCKTSKINDRGTVVDATVIGSYAFEGISDLTEFEICDPIERIESFAFKDCENLSTFTPNYNTDKNLIIEEFAFDGCNNLPVVNNFRIISGTNVGVFLLNVTEYFCETYTIPEHTRVIGRACFCGCAHVKKIELPDSVTTIQKCAFSCCHSLSEINTPNSITIFEESAFDGGNFPIKENIQYADKYLIQVADKSLETYNIQFDTRWIGQYAFQDCENLKNIYFPNYVETIGNGVFENCKNLEEIDFNNIYKLGGYMFLGCTKLKKIIFKSKTLDNFDDWLFYGNEGIIVDSNFEIYITQEVYDQYNIDTHKWQNSDFKNHIKIYEKM